MRTYDILVQSLHPEYYKRRAGANNVITKWERGVKANTLSEASAKACAKNSNLGCTPTTMSMGWEVLY